MALKLYRRNDQGPFYLRGTTLSGERVYESTKIDDEGAAEKLRVKRENDALNTVLNGEIKNCTFAKAAAAYYANGGEQTYVGKEKNGKWTGLIGYFGDRILRTITQSELDEAGRRLYPGCQPSTVNRQCHAPFVSVWNLAHRDGFCDHRSWSRPKWTRGQFNGLTKGKMKRRVGSFPVEYDHAASFVLAMSPAPAMVMTALFYTGMRPSELFRLEGEAVNIAKRYIDLDWNTKTEDPRRIPLHEILVPMFTALAARGGILFRTPRGEPYPVAEDDEKVSGQMKTAIDGARRRSGIKDIAPYTARHTVSTQLIAEGVGKMTKDQILGHYHDGDPSWDYTHVPMPTLLAAINTLPAIEAWATAPWMTDPLAYASKLAEGTGARTDLLKLTVRREKRAKVKAKKTATIKKREYRAARRQVINEQEVQNAD